MARGPCVPILAHCILDRSVAIGYSVGLSPLDPMARTKEFDPARALESAMQLFWLQGYEATSVRELCEHMGIQKGSLYDTFGSKRALYLAALERYLKLNLPPADFYDNLGSAKSTIAEIFAHKVDISVADKQCRGCFFVNTIVELAPHDAEFAAIGKEGRKEYEETFYRLLAIGQRTGDIRPERDITSLANYLTNSMFGLRVMAKTTRDRQVLEGIVETTLSVLD